MASGWVGLPQLRRILLSERVALRPVLPGLVVTWFVTGFPDPGKVADPHPVLFERLSLLSLGKTSLRWRGESAKAGNMAATIPICGFLR
jgi:hypothetical protein